VGLLAAYPRRHQGDGEGGAAGVSAISVFVPSQRGCAASSQGRPDGIREFRLERLEGIPNPIVICE
jgi:hypothetical protein